MRWPDRRAQPIDPKPRSARATCCLPRFQRDARTEGEAGRTELLEEGPAAKIEGTWSHRWRRRLQIASNRCGRRPSALKALADRHPDPWWRRLRRQFDDGKLIERRTDSVRKGLQPSDASGDMGEADRDPGAVALSTKRCGSERCRSRSRPSRAAAARTRISGTRWNQDRQPADRRRRGPGTQPERRLKREREIDGDAEAQAPPPPSPASWAARPRGRSSQRSRIAPSHCSPLDPGCTSRAPCQWPVALPILGGGCVRPVSRPDITTNLSGFLQS